MHPYLFNDKLDNLPPYMEIIKSDDVKIFNKTGEKDVEKNTTPMEIEIKPVSLESIL